MSAPGPPTSRATPVQEDAGDGIAVRGALHTPPGGADRGLVLTHGAGSSSESPLLVALADALVAHRVAVLRCDLPFRQARPQGPPSPAGAARDRAGLRAAVLALRRAGPTRVSLGGHSYGGRQASILAADEPDVAQSLLLLAYPLHPPNRPADLRVAHFGRIRVATLFVHGTMDPFGSVAELRSALAGIPGPAALHLEPGAGHDLGASRHSRAGLLNLAARIAARWLELAP
jgi:predicted alpha/beta-hydrolase family hydrolase